jgi:hypothetical protein
MPSSELESSDSSDTSEFNYSFRRDLEKAAIRRVGSLVDCDDSGQWSVYRSVERHRDCKRTLHMSEDTLYGK